jgi:peptide/nickel transport system permease protein
MGRTLPAALSSAVAPAPTANRSWLKMSWTRFRQHRAALLGLVLLGIVAGGVLIGLVAVPERAAFFTDVKALRQPPSLRHLLGTDEVGRDIFARVVYAGRVSLMVGLLVALLGVTVGTLAGAAAGFFGGLVDDVIMRLVDVLLSIPQLFSLIVLAVMLGPSLQTTIVAIASLSWMEIARIVRGNVLAVRETDFVLAARAVGCSPWRILLRHVLPNTLAPLTVAATLTIGNMIMVTVLATNLIGEGIRDAIDPRVLVRTMRRAARGEGT